MPALRDLAIPVRTWDYSETSQTVCLFTKEHGCVRALAKGAKREKSRFSGGIEILTLGEAVALTKPSSDLANLIEWDLQHIFWGLRASLAAHHAGLYAADLIYHMVTDHDPHPTLFDHLTAALDALADPAAIAHALLRFQWSLLDETGYQPRLTDDTPSGSAPLLFDPADGGIVAAPAPHRTPWRVRPHTVRLLQQLDDATPGEPIDDDPKAVLRAGSLLAAYIRHILDKDLPTRRLVYPAPQTRSS